ncbi:hypothetical protein [Fulvimarina sp. MAC3]
MRFHVGPRYSCTASLEVLVEPVRAAGEREKQSIAEEFYALDVAVPRFP